MMKRQSLRQNLQQNLRQSLGRNMIGRILFAAVVLAALMSMGVSAKTTTKVHPYYYAGRMRRDVSTNAVDIPSGAKVTVIQKGSSVYKVKYKGKTCKVPASAVALYDFITNGSHRYGNKTAEAFVNGRGYSSSTDYLVWISTYTQHLYVFKGSKRNWKVIGHKTCATGRWEHDTPLGISKINYKLPWLWFNQDVGQGGYYGMRIRGGFIHSWLYNIAWAQAHGGRKLIWNKEHYGKPTSSGCVRVTIKFAKWMYKTVPLNTTAVVY